MTRRANWVWLIFFIFLGLLAFSFPFMWVAGIGNISLPLAIFEIMVGIIPIYCILEILDDLFKK